MSSFPLRVPEDLKEKASALAAKAGVSLNHYIVMALASRVGAQAETERYFMRRATRATPGKARRILVKAGRRARPRPDDRLDSPEE